MKFPDVDWGATFEEDCIAAVEGFVAGERRLRPQTLDYRGTDLGSALERQLYVAMMQNRALQYLYACMLAKSAPEPQRVPKDLLGPASRLVPSLTGYLRVEPNSGTVRDMAASPLKRLIYAGASLAPPRSRPVLAAVHHPKFVRYIRPIADAMPGMMSFLVAPRSASRRYDFLLHPDERMPLPHAVARKNAASKAWPNLCRWAEELDTALEWYRPSCVLTVEGDAPQHELLARRARHHGITALCLQWGAFPYRSPRNGFRRMGHDAFLTWGEGFAEQLRPYNPGLDFVPVGNPGINPLPSAKARRVIFFFQGANNTTIQPWHWREFLEFTAWTASQHRDWQILVRPHPSLPITAQEHRSLAVHPNIKLEDPATVSLRQSLDGAALAVAMTSSAILEAAAEGAVPFLFNPTTAVPRFNPDFESWNAGIEVKRLEDAKLRMSELLGANDPDAPAIARFRPGLERLVRHFFCATGATALARIRGQITAAIITNPRLKP